MRRIVLTVTLLGLILLIVITLTGCNLKKDDSKELVLYELDETNGRKDNMEIETEKENVPTENSIGSDTINNDDIKNIENNIKEVISEYYGEDYTNGLFNRINEEIQNNTGSYKIPEASLEMLDKALNIYNNSNANTEEKESIEEFIDQIDINFIEDNDMVNKIKESGILENLNITQ